MAAPASAAAQDTDEDSARERCLELPTEAEQEACLDALPPTPDLDQTEIELEAGEDTGDVTGPDQGTIIVTGTRIVRPNLSSNVPITSVGEDEILDQGALSLGDALNDLPSLRSTFSTSNSQRFIGTTGLNILDLRGLGTDRTLVLVNGRRHVTASVGSFNVDVNTIPFELLERIDVVTGGNSAVYGSDAIAGVVNFILKRNFEGIELSGQGGISEEGDRGAYYAALTAGQNFGDGRGNVAITAEASFTDPIFNVNRPDQTGAFVGFDGFITTDVDSGEDDGVPDQTFQENVRYNFISEGGTLTTFCFGDPAIQPLACDASGQQIFYEFTRDGRLRRAPDPAVDFRDVLAPFGSSFQIGGTGSTLSDYGTLYPEIDRYSVNLLAHYDVSDAFRPFIEFTYSRLEAFQEGSPSFTNSFCGGLVGIAGISNACDVGQSSGVAIPLDNAFLNPEDAELIRNIQQELLIAAGVPPALTQPGGPFFPTFFRLNRNNLDLGPRSENINRDTWQVVAGFDGRFNDDWKYEISMVYGEFDEDLFSLNNLVKQNFRNAVDSVRDGSGNPVCRINVDADPANNDPNCVPLNPFGVGAPSAAAIDYVNTTSFTQSHAEMLDILAYLNGDLSQLFEFPGGPVRFVIGGEYRREESFQDWDDFVSAGNTFLNAIPDFRPPPFEVIEGFGEIQIPLLANMPFFQELELYAAGRVSDYNEGAGNTDTTFAYNLGAIWAPVEDLRFRANYSRAVRAPTPGALFTEQTQNFAFLSDPCDRRNINDGPPVRVTNCRSNTPIGNVPPDYEQQSGNRPILQGGNPLLEEETSNSLTIGAIIQPRFLPGLSLTIDYYDIDVNDIIAQLSGNTILQQCYDSDTFPNNQFCDLIFPRQPDGKFNAEAALLVSTVNFAKLKARGLDFDLAYRRTFENDDRLSLRLIATRALESTGFLDPVDPEDANRFLTELGDPEWAFNFGADYRRGIATISYDMRYIGKMTIGAYENYFEFDGEDPINPDLTEEIFYPEQFIHDIRFELRPVPEYTFYIGVDNFTDELPPFGLTGAGGGSSIYDNVGRFFYAGAVVEF
ncbi:MAG: TonB-dependent receptor domain-containing protein [Sphingomonadaceae bacterium]